MASGHSIYIVIFLSNTRMFPCQCLIRQITYILCVRLNCLSSALWSQSNLLQHSYRENGIFCFILETCRPILSSHWHVLVLLFWVVFTFVKYSCCCIILLSWYTTHELTEFHWSSLLPLCHVCAFIWHICKYHIQHTFVRAKLICFSKICSPS